MNDLAQNLGGVMAACKTCGDKAGAFREECKPCEGKRQAERLRQMDEQAKASQQEERLRKEQAGRELQQRKESYVDSAVEGMRQTLAEGRTPYLHTTIYLSTDFVLNKAPGGAPPDLHDLDTLGRDGWEVVATVPQTMGVGLANLYKGGGQNWGGGIGGIVTGMYAIARLAVTEGTLSSREVMIREVLRNRYEDGRSKPAEGPQIPLLASGTNKTGTVAPLAAAAASVAAVSMAMDAIVMADDASDDGGDFGDFDF
jgi:hypothetical protein